MKQEVKVIEKKKAMIHPIWGLIVKENDNENEAESDNREHTKKD